MLQNSLQLDIYQLSIILLIYFIYLFTNPANPNLLTKKIKITPRRNEC